MTTSRAILIRVLGAMIALAGIVVLVEERGDSVHGSGSYFALIAIGCGVAFEIGRASCRERVW